MTLTIIQMAGFLIGVETKSFTKAGDDLGLPQSTVSHILKLFHDNKFV